MVALIYPFRNHCLNILLFESCIPAALDIKINLLNMETPTQRGWHIIFFKIKKY